MSFLRCLIIIRTIIIPNISPSYCNIGTKLAGVFGEVPVKDMLNSCQHRWQQLAYQTDDRSFVMPTYIDNLFSSSSSMSGAIQIIEEAGEYLLQHWALKRKPGSKHVLVARGAEIDLLSERFPALGHIIDSAGGIGPCWNNTKQAMWKICLWQMLLPTCQCVTTACETEVYAARRATNF